MDLNHRSLGYEPSGLTWLPYPARLGNLLVEASRPSEGLPNHKTPKLLIYFRSEVKIDLIKVNRDKKACCRLLDYDDL